MSLGVSSSRRIAKIVLICSENVTVAIAEDASIKPVELLTRPVRGWSRLILT